jgi:hypothetical protein
MSTLYVNKVSDTSADTLQALGVAELFRKVLSRLDKPKRGIVLRDVGDSIAIKLPCTLRYEELHSEQRIPLISPLITAKQREKQVKKGRDLKEIFDYDGQREKQTEFIAKRQALEPEHRTPEAIIGRDEQLEALLRSSSAPDRHYTQYVTINVMKVSDTFNEIAFQWRELTAAQQWQTVALLYTLFSQRENDLQQARKTWEQIAKEQHITGKTMVTAVQAINPTTGKGSNTTKGLRLSNGGLDSFWLLELLKFQGFMLGSAPFVIKGSKDRKTYVIAPRTVVLETLDDIMYRFRHACWPSTAIKQDILASLRLAQILVRHRHDEFESQRNIDEFDDEPEITSITNGFDVTSYKDMGSAHATMNVTTVNIPNCFPPLETLQDTEGAKLLIEEHLRIVRRIEGYQGKETNDEIALLQYYRDFLSGHDLRPFWLFAAHYGNYLFRQRDHEKDVKRWLPQLTMKGLAYLVEHQPDKQHNLHIITEQKGFQNIANAIREATIRAQRRRSQDRDNTYEVHYGLGQELMRKARQCNDFMITLNRFLLSYNEETTREEEKVANRLRRRLTSADYKANKLRFPVSTKDIRDIEVLLDDYPTELIASMLVAHGYARYKQVSAEEIQSEQANTNDDEQNDQSEEE